jgi:hypothetical protein
MVALADHDVVLRVVILYRKASLFEGFENYSDNHDATFRSTHQSEALNSRSDQYIAVGCGNKENGYNDNDDTPTLAQHSLKNNNVLVGGAR